jgi:signal transduction histidine kinase
VVLLQEKVLAEISHELGNFFHKLYYWSQYLREAPARESADSTPCEMLERTIRGLEDFLKMSLGYFNPVHLSAVPMRAAEVVEGMLFQARARLDGTPLTVTQEADWRDAEMLVDPGQMSLALEIVMRYLAEQIGPESQLGVSVGRGTRRGCPGLEIRVCLQDPSEASPLFRTAEAGVEWAVAERIVTLHGGELVQQADDRGEKTLIVFLPLQPLIEVEREV